MATERRPKPPSGRFPQANPPSGPQPRLKPQAPMLPPAAPAAPPPQQQRPTTRSLARGTAPAQKPTGRTTRVDARASGRVALGRKSNAPLFIGLGVGGGVLVLILIIVAVSSGGGSKNRGSASNSKEAAFVRPVDVSGLESAGESHCEEGLALVQECEELMSGRALSGDEKSRLKTKLEKAMTLIKEGLNMLEEASEKTRGQNKYSTTKYTNALKAARMKMGELGGK